MAYSRKHNYKSMREKNRNFWRKLKVSFVLILIAFIVYIIKNRVYLKDYLMTYF